MPGTGTVATWSMRNKEGFLLVLHSSGRFRRNGLEAIPRWPIAYFLANRRYS